MTDLQAAWCAGVVDSMGSFTNPQIYKPRVKLFGCRYELRTSKDNGLVRQFAEYTNTPIKTRVRNKHSKSAEAVIFSEDRLHELMVRLWPYLTKARQHDYATVRRTSKDSTFSSPVR